MNNVRGIPQEKVEQALERIEKRGNLNRGGEPPDNGTMEARVKRLEEAIAGLPNKADFADLRADLSKASADMHKAIAENHKWTHGALLGLAGLSVVGIIGMMATIWNVGKPSAPAAPTSPPIIINVPSAAPAPVVPPK